MTTPKEFTNLWQSLSQKVLACVLVDDGAIFPVSQVIGTNSRWFSPPNEAKIWDIVLQCLSDNTPPTGEAGSLKLDGAVPLAYIRTLAGQFSDEDNRHLVYNTEQLRAVGIIAELHQFGRELVKIDSIEDINRQVDKITTKLACIVAGVSTRDSDSKSVSDVAWRIVEQQQEPGIPTGLQWFDNLVGGLWRGMNYWVVADYKRGKTTLLRNCVLRAATLNNPVGIFCAEGSRELFTLDCQGMIATELLLDAGIRGDGLRLNGLFIKRHYWTGGVFSKQELDAIHEAKEIWNGLPIYTLDTKDNIRNHSTLRYLVKSNRVNHGITSFWGDYSQLFGDGKIYDRQSATALLVQDIAVGENVAFCMLAQRSEEGVKSSGGYTAFVKGGGDASAAADFLLMPAIDEDTPTILNVQLKHSRHTKTGQGTHLLAPASGLIIDKWS